MKSLPGIAALVLAALISISCSASENQLPSAPITTWPTSTASPSFSVTANTADRPDPTQVPSQTALSTPPPSSTAAALCANMLSDNSLYLDQHPAFAVRQGPGCEYPEFSGEISKPDSIAFFEILGKYQDWLLVDLCNDQQGWVFAPATDPSNLMFDPDRLPLITPQPALLPSSTSPAADQASALLDQAGETLVSFFELLNLKNYQEAVDLFGGGYGIVINWNPEVDPNDEEELLSRGCEFNGFECFLRLNRIVNAEQVSPLQYHFTVEFLNPDGSIHQRRGMDGMMITQFLFRVARDCNGKFLVVDWPFYEQYGG